jgi:hypothetical protein
VGPRGATVVDWDGQLITDDVKPRAGTSGTFACFRSRALPAGSYRVAIRVFDDEASAVANVGGRLVTRDFDLPTANNAVDVPLSVNPLDNCDPEPNAAAPPCTGAEAHDVRCSLVSPLSFAWEGGLALWGDSSQLTPQNAYDRVRDFYQDTTRPDMTCTAAVPRCSRDSRVVTASDVTRVVNEPSVVAAFGAGPPVYGYDDRANDGTVLILRRPDGRGVVIGSPCAGCFVANPVTPALLAINPVLRGLEQQMLSTDGCAGFRSPGASF